MYGKMSTMQLMAVMVFALMAVVAQAADPAPAPAPAPQAPLPAQQEGTASPSGDVRIARVLEANTLIAGAMLAVNMTVRSNLDVSGTLSASLVKAQTVSTRILKTASLSSPSGVIIVNGDLTITSRPDQGKDKLAPPQQLQQQQATEGNTQTVTTPIVKAASFLAEDLVVGGVRQWKLVRHEDFDQGAEGWSLAEVSSCAGHPADKFLGGHCNAAAATTTKRFEGLPPHSQVRLTARYHFIDAWKGETAFLKLGEHLAWADRHHAPAEPHLGLHMCGSADHAESRMSSPVDVTLPHDASFLEVSFGSTGAAGEDACQRSFGVDDVMLYVR